MAVTSTPLTPRESIAFNPGKFGAIIVDNCGGPEARRALSESAAQVAAPLAEALNKLLGTTFALAAQQAMYDDSWRAGYERARAALAAYKESTNG